MARSIDGARAAKAHLERAISTSKDSRGTAGQDLTGSAVGDVTPEVTWAGLHLRPRNSVN